MRTAIGIGSADSGKKRDFDDAVAFAVEADRMGVDCVWSAEAWGQDAIAPLAWVGARTERIRLGTGIMQISARAPSTTAMTALTMAAISGDRFNLGLGASGPQVVEGLHGRPFRAPLARMRETVEIVRLAFEGEKLEYQGTHHQMPFNGEGATGQGKALRLSQPGNTGVPIYLATLAPKALELTGAIADGWLGTSFTPEGAEAHLAHLRRGAEGAGRSLRDIDIQVGGMLAFGDPEALAEPLKRNLAFTLGAMGSAQTNFYNDAFKRGGWEEDARAVQALWLEGHRDKAIARVPTEMVLQANLLGDEAMVSERMRAFRDAGVNTLRLAPQGRSAFERLDVLGRGLELLSAL
ncbi:MAG: LLM class flavin-dependent oxidoreductase [Pseudomonadales bacterium]|nr:LLM class flavin-dependent oxidoreductase [Pseudomonadales bacterium]